MGSIGADTDLFWIVAQLELLGEIEVRVMHRSARTPERWIGVSVRNVSLGGDGLLSTVSAHAGTLEDALRELFRELTQPPSGRYVVVDAWRDNRRAFTWDHEFGSWVRVSEVLAS